MGAIDWIPIADMPDALKDGRTFLVWAGHPCLGQWLNGKLAYTRGTVTPTHFAEINAPS